MISSDKSLMKKKPRPNCEQSDNKRRLKNKTNTYSIFEFWGICRLSCERITAVLHFWKKGQLVYLSWLNFAVTPVKLHIKGRPQNSPSWPCVWSLWTCKKFRSHPSWIFTFAFAFWIYIVFLVPLRPLNQVISMNYLVLPKPFITQFIINVVRPWKSLLMILLRKAHRRQANNLGTGKYALF